MLRCAGQAASPTCDWLPRTKEFVWEFHRFPLIGLVLDAEFRER